MDMWIGLGWITFTAIVIAGIAVLFDWWQEGRKWHTLQQSSWEDTANQAEQWAKLAYRKGEQFRGELLEMEEEVQEMRYLLAEVCKQVSLACRSICPGTEPAPPLRSVYNDLDRLADEAVKAYELERPGRPREIPFPPVKAAGSE